MREYFNKKFYKNCIYKERIFKTPVEYEIYTAGLQSGYIEFSLEIDKSLIKKGIEVCKKELKSFGKCDAAGANQGYLEDIFVIVHWKEKQIIFMHKDDK